MNHHLFDYIIQKHTLRSDAHFAGLIPMTNSQASHMRAGDMKIGAGHIVNIHLEFDIPIVDIKRFVALPAVAPV